MCQYADVPMCQLTSLGMCQKCWDHVFLTAIRFFKYTPVGWMGNWFNTGDHNTPLAGWLVLDSLSYDFFYQHYTPNGVRNTLLYCDALWKDVAQILLPPLLRNPQLAHWHIGILAHYKQALLNLINTITTTTPPKMPQLAHLYSYPLILIRKSNKFTSELIPNFFRNRYRLISTPRTEIFISCAISLVDKFIRK